MMFSGGMPGEVEPTQGLEGFQDIEQVLTEQIQLPPVAVEFESDQAHREAAQSFLTLIEAGKPSDELIERVNEQEKMAKNVPDVDREGGFARLHVPLVQPIVDIVRSKMVYSLLGGETPVVAKHLPAGVPADAAQKIEKTFAFFLGIDDGYKRFLHKAIKRACIQHLAIGRAIYKPQSETEMPRFTFSTIRLANYSVYPVGPEPLTDKTCVFERVYVLKRELDESIKQGILAEPVGGGKLIADAIINQDIDAELSEFNRSDTVNLAVEEEDGYVELWQGWRKWKAPDAEEAIWWWAIIAPQSNCFLKLQPFMERKIWDVVGALEEDVERFFPPVGLATHLQGLQNEMNAVVNDGLDCLGFFSLNVWNQERVPGAVLPDTGHEQVKTVRPGQVNPAGVMLKPALTHQTGNEILPWVEQIWRRAQIVAAVSDMQFGQSVQGGSETLGETQIINQEVAVSFDDRTSIFASTFCVPLFETMRSQLLRHWEDWFPVYGVILGLEDTDKVLFAQPMQLVPGNTSLRNTPLGKRQDMERLAGFLKTNFPLFLQGAGYELASQYLATYDVPGRSRILMDENQAMQMLVKLATERQQQMEAPQGTPAAQEDYGAPS